MYHWAACDKWPDALRGLYSSAFNFQRACTQSNHDPAHRSQLFGIMLNEPGDGTRVSHLCGVRTECTLPWRKAGLLWRLHLGVTACSQRSPSICTHANSNTPAEPVLLLPASAHRGTTYLMNRSRIANSYDGYNRRTHAPKCAFL